MEDQRLEKRLEKMNVEIANSQSEKALLEGKTKAVSLSMESRRKQAMSKGLCNQLLEVYAASCSCGGLGKYKPEELVGNIDTNRKFCLIRGMSEIEKIFYGDSKYFQDVIGLMYNDQKVLGLFFNEEEVDGYTKDLKNFMWVTTYLPGDWEESFKEVASRSIKILEKENELRIQKIGEEHAKSKLASHQEGIKNLFEWR